MLNPSPEENYFNLSIAGYICRLVFEKPELYNHLKKEFPPHKESHKNPFLKFKMIGKTHFIDNLSRYKIIKNRKTREGIAYYFPPNKYSKTLTRNIKFGLSILLQYFLLDKKILFIHASSVIYKEKAYLFPGKSGAGKSTIAFNFPKKNVLSDDVAIIRKIKGVFYLYSSPFDYKKYPFVKEKVVPLAGIFFLDKASNVTIKTVDFPSALNSLFYNSNLIYYGGIVNKTLKKKKYIRFKQINNFKDEEIELWGKTFDHIYRFLFDMIAVVPVKKLSFTKKFNVDTIFV